MTSDLRKLLCQPEASENAYWIYENIDIKEESKLSSALFMLAEGVQCMSFRNNWYALHGQICDIIEDAYSNKW